MSNYTKRTTAVPMPIFIEKVAKPIMRKVAAKKIKKNIGLVLSAIAGGIHFLPCKDEYTGTTNPIQTLSSHLSHYKCQPNNLMPENDKEDSKIRVYPMVNKENLIPENIIKRFIELCKQYNIDYTIFTEKGGEIELDTEILKVIAYFASDKGLTKEKQIWGKIKPISHIPIELLEEKDIPMRKKNKIVGRKKGRPKKN